MTCTDPLRELVPAWVAGELRAADAERVEAHVAQCAECAGTARVLREMIGVGTALFAGLEPPETLRDLIVDSPCRRWERALMAALDRELPEERLGGLLEHLDACPACASVWEALVALRETGADLVVPPGLEARCQAVRYAPEASGMRWVPGSRTAMAAAYVAALLLSLALGNPVALARHEVRAAAGHLQRTVQTHAATLHEEGRGELRMFVWRLWRLGSNAAETVREAFRTFSKTDQTKPNEDRTRNGDRV